MIIDCYFDNVVPIPIPEDVNEIGLTTNFLIVSLYLKLKIGVDLMLYLT